jgi:hypothetical protein
MDDEFKIDRVEKIPSNVGHVDAYDKRRKREKKHRDEASKHFQELTETAEKAHVVLIEKNSPYRFCIYQENEDIFIDVVIIDTDGSIKEIHKRNITHDEFISWVRHIEQESGLLIDNEV